MALDILGKGGTAFRDFLVDGLPASGENEPVKAEVRAFVSDVAEGVAVAMDLADGAVLPFDTRAALYLDLAHVAGVYGRVLADSTLAYNGYYKKVGGSGSGSWTYVGPDLGKTYADMAAASATAAAGSEGAVHTDATTASAAAVQAVDAAADAREAADEITDPTNYSSEAIQFFDRLPVRMRRGRKAAYDNLFRNLVYTGEYAALDVVRILDAAEPSTALANLVTGSYLATLTGDPAFTVDLGYTGVANGSKRIGTGFNPATAVGPHWGLSSATMGVFLGGAVADSGSGLAGEATATYLSQSAGSPNLTVGLNSASGLSYTLSQNKASGAISASRTGNDIKAYHFGALLGTGTSAPAGSLVSAELNMLAFAATTNGGRTVVERAFWAGGAMTDAGNRNMAAYIGNCLDDLDGLSFVARQSSSFDVTNDTASNLLPGLCKLLDGRSLMTWTVRDLTYATGDVLKGQLIAADGKTALGSPFVIGAAALKVGYSESIAFCDPATGTVLVSAYKHEWDATPVSTVVFRASNPQGGPLVFAAPYTVPSTFTAPCSSGAMAKFGSRIALPLYDNNGVTNKVCVVWSTDDGVTFGNQQNLLTAALVAGDRYNETALAVNPSTGKLEAWIRNGDEANADPANPNTSVIGYYTMELAAYGGSWSAPIRQIFTTFPGRPDPCYAPNGDVLLILRGRNTSDSDNFPAVGWSIRRNGGWQTPQWLWVTGTKSYGGYCYSQTIWDAALQRFASLISFGGFTAAARIIRLQFEHRA